MNTTKVVIVIDAPTFWVIPKPETEIKQKITITKNQVTLTRYFNEQKSITTRTKVETKVLEKVVQYLHNDYEQVLAMDAGTEIITEYNGKEKQEEYYTTSSIGQYIKISKELRKLTNLPKAWFLEYKED